MRKILFASPLYFTSPVKIGGHQYARLFSENGWETYYFSNPLSPFNIVFNKNRNDVLERMKIYLRGGIHLNKVWSYVPLTFVPHHKEEGLNLRTNRLKRKRAAVNHMDRPDISTINQCWSIYFISDLLYDGRLLRALTEAYNFSLKCMAIFTDQFIKELNVGNTLDRLSIKRMP